MIELLDAARSALGDDVLPQLDGRAAFQTRVTMRALGIVRRELMLAADHSTRRADALRALRFGSEAELATAIREGVFADREPGSSSALRTLVKAKLEVANPDTSRPRKDTS